jgi:hypothetical protein
VYRPACALNLSLRANPWSAALAVADMPEWDAESGVLRRNFNAFDVSYTGGVRVASADVNGDGKDDILAAQGLLSTPLERAFDGTTLAQLSENTPYSGVGIFVGGKRRRF